MQSTDRLSIESNYLVGSKAVNWQTYVANHGRATYSSLYQGIDGVFYRYAEQLEHDFIVRPGADFRQIRMKVSAGAHATIDADGGLLFDLPGGQVRIPKSSMSPPPFRKTGPLLGLAFLPLWCTARKQGRKAIFGVLCLLLLAVTSGCGGNNSSTPTQPASVLKVVPGTYTVQVIATDGVTTSKTQLSLIVE